MILNVLATALVCGVGLVDVAGASGTAVENMLAAGIAWMLATLAGWAALWGCCSLHEGRCRRGRSREAQAC